MDLDIYLGRRSERERENERDLDIKIIKHVKTILGRIMNFRKSIEIEWGDLWQAETRKEPI